MAPALPGIASARGPGERDFRAVPAGSSKRPDPLPPLGFGMQTQSTLGGPEWAFTKQYDGMTTAQLFGTGTLDLASRAQRSKAVQVAKAACKRARETLQRQENPYRAEGSDPKPPLEPEWARMRPYELKKHCRGRGLAEDGPKATLVARLQGREQSSSPGAAETSSIPTAPASDPEAEARATAAAALKDAAKAGNVAEIKQCLADGVPVDTVDEQGYTPLYCATMYEKEEAVVTLLAAGAAVDQENNNGVSPLMAAARDGYTAIVGRLLAAGADFTQVDEFGRTAVSLAEEKGHPETAAAVTA